MLDTFEAHRDRLMALAYRMLGVHSDAEDIVQEAFLRWSAVSDGPNPDAIRSAGPFLTRIVTHLCIDELRSARRRREAYVGEWLPEPIETSSETDPSHRAALADSLSMAFLRLLETLSPPERAAFLLRDVFALDYEEVADAVGVTEVNARQIAHRARKRVQKAGRPRFDTTGPERDRLLDRFQEAVTTGNLDGLRGTLAEDVALYADGGGRALVAGRPLNGSAQIVQFVLGLRKRYGDQFDGYRRTYINGDPALVFESAGQISYVWSFHIEGGRIQGIYVSANPEKLGQIGGQEAGPR